MKKPILVLCSLFFALCSNQPLKVRFLLLTGSRNDATIKATTNEKTNQPTNQPITPNRSQVRLPASEILAGKTKLDIAFTLNTHTQARK